jgi:hypothetical protein
MAKAKRRTLIPRTGRAMRYLPRAGGGIVPYRVSCCVRDHIHIELGDGSDGKEITELVFADPDDAFTFARQITLAYDVATGIVEPTD